ncbi:hypothetical protein CERZMDRAFT_18001, partial [Cercospora zeae-maydis SCOH1-5]
EAFWELHTQGRPLLPDILLRMVWMYHSSKGGSFDVVHEPGAGIGLYTERLAQKFRHVITSDTERSSLDIATRRLRHLKNVEYRLAKMESAMRLPREEVDMVFAVNVTHFTDTERMIDALDRQLRPGGTFAAIIVGPSRLDDPAAQNLWKRLWFNNLNAAMQSTVGGIATDQSWLDKFVNGLDTLPLPNDIFEHGHTRIFFNAERAWQDKVLPSGVSSDGTPSQITERDRTFHMEGDESFHFSTDISGLRMQLAAMAPAGLSSEVETCLEELDRSLNGRTVSGKFVVQCLLATK